MLRRKKMEACPRYADLLEEFNRRKFIGQVSDGDLRDFVVHLRKGPKFLWGWDEVHGWDDSDDISLRMKE